MTALINSGSMSLSSKCDYALPQLLDLEPEFVDVDCDAAAPWKGIHRIRVQGMRVD